MQFSSVDLPQPDEPSSTRNSPSSMSRLRLLQHLDGAEVEVEVLDLDRDSCLVCHAYQPFTAPAAMPRTKSLPETK